MTKTTIKDLEKIIEMIPSRFGIVVCDAFDLEKEFIIDEMWCSKESKKMYISVYEKEKTNE